MGESIGTYTPIEDLKEWDNNPRNNDHAVDEVAKSIKRFGFASPIIARKEDNMVIAGHTRLAAARSLGLDTVPVRFVDLDPTEAQLLALADNKIGELADWDQDLLSEVLTDLKDEDLSGLGFSDAELEELIEEAQFEPLDNVIEEDLEDEDWDQMPAESVKIAKAGGVYQIGGQQVACGDCIEVMRSLPDNSVDSIVTDPPYGIGFMGKGWDHSVPSEEWAKECLRVLKDGGHLICFAATRTVHRLAVAVEDAGFEIRDQLGWCYYSGFPKSMDISKQIDKMAGAEREPTGTAALAGMFKQEYQIKQGYRSENGKQGYKGEREGAIRYDKPTTKEAQYWQGWGTALKPAYEPCVLARKPIAKKNVASQVLKTGTGAINIDACRFGYGDPCWIGPQDSNWIFKRTDKTGRTGGGIMGDPAPRGGTDQAHDLGRWPANLYQCPKPSRSERDEGLTDLESKAGFEVVNRKEGSSSLLSPRAGAGRTAGEVKNFHPTVKPVNLMRWLVRLVTPVNGLVLEPFLGSGTTGVASSLEGFRSIGIEREPDYADICLQRIKNAEGVDIVEIEALRIERLEEDVCLDEQS